MKLSPADLRPNSPEGRAEIAAMPEWTREVGEFIAAQITDTDARLGQFSTELSGCNDRQRAVAIHDLIGYLQSYRLRLAEHLATLKQVR